MSDHLSKGTALITGASAGIGAIYADRLARRGHDLILVARSREKLDDVARRISDDTGRSVEVIPADLTKPSDLGDIEKVLASDQSITVLINNAGIGATATLLSSNISEMEEMIAINVNALVRLTYAVSPSFVERSRGTIINISSIVAIGPEMLNGVYGASKSFVLAFSQSLNHELRDKGVQVQVVLPGVTATNFWGNAGASLEDIPGQMVMRAEHMVDAALSGLDQGELVTIPALPDVVDWRTYEDARQKMLPNLSRSAPANRYNTE